MEANSNFDSGLKAARCKCIIFTAISAAAVAAMWICDSSIANQDIENMSLYISMQYLSMLATGFGIWYGIHSFDKTASILKEKDDIQEKQDNYLKACKFRFILVLIPIILDTALYFAVQNSMQFCLAATAALVFGIGAIPSQSKFESDFFKEIILGGEEDDAAN